jgi:hypothetical protein
MNSTQAAGQTARLPTPEPPALQPINQLRPRNSQRPRSRRQIALRTLHRDFQQRGFDIVERSRFDVAADAHQPAVHFSGDPFDLSVRRICRAVQQGTSRCQRTVGAQAEHLRIDRFSTGEKMADVDCAAIRRERTDARRKPSPDYRRLRPRAILRTDSRTRPALRTARIVRPLKASEATERNRMQLNATAAGHTPAANSTALSGR